MYDPIWHSSPNPGSPTPSVQSAIQWEAVTRGRGSSCESPPNSAPRKEDSTTVVSPWRSELLGWSPCPTRGSWLSLGLHMLHTGQDFLLVSCQSDSNSEKVLGRDLTDHLKGAEASRCKTFLVSSHLDGSKPLAHRTESRVVRLPLVQEWM